MDGAAEPDAGVAKAKKVVSPAVARIRLLSYITAKSANYQMFSSRMSTLKPILEKTDVEKLVGVLERHGKAQPEAWLKMPVEAFLTILTYLPLRGDRCYASNPFQSKKRMTTIDRVLLSNSFCYFLVMENDHVKHPTAAPQSFPRSTEVASDAAVVTTGAANRRRQRFAVKKLAAPRRSGVELERLSSNSTCTETDGDD